MISQNAEERREYTEKGTPVIEWDGSKQEQYLGRVYEQMLDNAESNFFRRPILESFDNSGHRVSWLAIPTLEDLKYALYEASDSILDIGPEKVYSIRDIETAAYVSDCSYQFRFVPTLASLIRKMLSNTIVNFQSECSRSGGTTKMFEVNRSADLTVDEFFKKYYEGL